MYRIVFVKNAESEPKIDKLNFQKILSNELKHALSWILLDPL